MHGPEPQCLVCNLEKVFDLHTSFFNVCKTRKDNNCLPHVNIVISNFWLTLVKKKTCHFTEWEGTARKLRVRIATQLLSRSAFHSSNLMSLCSLLVLSVQSLSLLHSLILAFITRIILNKIYSYLHMLHIYSCLYSPRVIECFPLKVYWKRSQIKVSAVLVWVTFFSYFSEIHHFSTTQYFITEWLLCYLNLKILVSESDPISLEEKKALSALQTWTTFPIQLLYLITY